MAALSPIEQLIDRVERLLLRHEEQRKTNALLLQQVHALTQERDALRGRLNAAYQRVDTLIQRLPVATGGKEDT